ncbi:MAG: carbohydrate ABC transporter permease [Hyphomicrobiales bacterium]
MPAASAPLPHLRSRRWLTRARGHLILIALSLLSVLPLYWMMVTSLRPENEIFSTVPWPRHPSLANFTRLLTEVPFGRMILNTFVVSLAVALGQLLTAMLAGYAFARWQGRLSRAVFALLTATWLIPQQVIMIPNYALVSRLGLLDTLPALIIPNLASAFAIMLLYQSFRSFPRELIEAAVVDGASHWVLLWKIIAPNMGAALASTGILIFVSTWNEYFWPLLVTRSMDNAVIQIGLQMFFTSEGNLWGPLMAAATLASLPILLIYIVLQKQIVGSFLKSGLR